MLLNFKIFRIIDWKVSLLKDSKQRVVIKEEESPWLEVASGVPYGPVFGLIFFLVYTKKI